MLDHSYVQATVGTLQIVTAINVLCSYLHTLAACGQPTALPFSRCTLGVAAQCIQ
jgi:hypothetical protein